MHLAGANNTGTAIILAPGGGHSTLVIGLEGADPVPFFFQYGINTIILRNRLRSDGYEPKTDGVYDLQQAIRMVRAHAAEWHIDPHKIGVVGFSAGAELTMASAIQYPEFNSKNGGDALGSCQFAARFCRLDLSGAVAVHPGLDQPRTACRRFRRMRRRPSSRAPAGRTRCMPCGRAEYFAAMLNAGIPNVEMHIYARGTHGNGLQYRDFTAEGTWQDRFVHWLRDLGFFGKSGEETLAAKDSRGLRDRAARQALVPVLLRLTAA